ncbi:hypothetical protein HDF19_01970 [Mucilaginibacter sp. E4BP6]|uniref:hypothetical protein n=1 Tax=Mucilaginibacter sp. E4BP6 TaxID=2723089 RepID=UPI0015CC029F|nr:hypothetical protein [Mucilaginibacter sp. E4BP6]NYE66642.1 hypothetical protein [Mucilaginibacter sp. E4BP6]
MKRTFIFILFITLILSSRIVEATNLRGQLIRNYNGQNYPLQQTRVDLLFWNIQAQRWDDVGFAITGNDGFYYFVNLSPGVTFCLLILGRYYPAQPLMVQDNSPYYQDLPLIST